MAAVPQRKKQRVQEGPGLAKATGLYVVAEARTSDAEALHPMAAVIGHMQTHDLQPKPWPSCPSKSRSLRLKDICAVHMAGSVTPRRAWDSTQQRNMLTQHDANISTFLQRNSSVGKIRSY